MKFSVLLPTRDRLDLLKLAVQSILRQDYETFEIIISDNNSTEPVADFVSSLEDERIVCISFDHDVSVTENWNNAIEHASGDYLIMLGDDDALCTNYFNRMSQLIESWGRPDCVYSSAYMFTYKGVLPGVDYGMVHESRNSALWRGADRPYWLDKSTRLELVNDSMSLFNSFGFNMQFVTISRAAYEKNRDIEGFFKTEYPDYYAMNNLLLNTEKFLVVEEPLVAIGASKRSFGWYYHNRQEKSGNKVLNIESGMRDSAIQIKGLVLPGTSMNTNWLTSMLKLHEDNKDVEGLLYPDVARYRRKQIIYFLSMVADGGCSPEDVRGMKEKLDQKERLLFLALSPLSRFGNPGRRCLAILHIASQKRASYLLKVLRSRLFGGSKLIKFTDDRDILESERLMNGPS